MIQIYEYAITFHGTIKVNAQNFKDIKIKESLEELGEVEELEIDNVEKKAI